ncbi:calpastatin-like isoform X7 [Anguilla anguilla]|uniref:calpastatin-like isoform X7 n=1 Tax=Anguilla anguilla TaxID=7936 RepID=UPI0015ADCE95|nr:calpastatin-like isoform X7 [Anguilla anguilla]
MPSKSRKHSRKRRRQAQRKAQAAAQVGPGGTPAAPSVAPVANGCPAPAEVVKIEDAVVNKSVPVEKTNDSPQVVPKSLSNDGALEALSAGFTKSAPIAPAEEPGSVPLDALNALSDILGSQEPEPEPPKIDPADIISERTLVTEEEAVLVGEDEDTIPPDYRFTENGTDLPPPKEEPSMDSGAALDILSGDFAAVPGAPPKQPCLEALDMLDGDFAAPAQAEEVQTDIPANQTSTDETLGVISCGPSAAIPSDTAVQALVEDAPAIADLSGNMVQAQS